MKLNFRQGLASFQNDTSGNPKFLQASATEKFISLIVSPTPTIATFAHGNSNYLQTFDRTVPNAWGPLIPNLDNWLYFDIDLLTANVTFGITTLTPVYSTIAPQELDGQHWFDQNTTTMKVWNNTANKWQAKVRVFAGLAQNGSTSMIESQPIGSQAYLNGDFDAGFILLDTLLKPLRISGGEFLTGDSDIRVKTTASTSGVLALPLNGFIAVQAGENIPVMSVVSFSTNGKIILANSSIEQKDQPPPVGVVMQRLTVNEIGPLTLAGEITFDQWDWTDQIGKVLYYDNFGKLSLIRPEGDLAYRIAIITSKNSILVDIDAETLPYVYSAVDAELVINGVDPIKAEQTFTEIGTRVVSISIAPATISSAGAMTAAQVQKLEASVASTDVINASIEALYQDKANVNHTHQISQIINLSSELANRAYVNHTHSIQNINGLQPALDGKADLLHVHTLANIPGLQAALDSKATTSQIFPVENITGLAAMLDAKADKVHTHSEFLKLAGGTLTGPLILSGPPSGGNDAVTKNYVDLIDASIRNFVTTEVTNSTSNLSFPLLAPSSFNTPSYSFADDVLTGISFSTLNDIRKLKFGLSDNKQDAEPSTFEIFAGGVKDDAETFHTVGAGISLSSSKLKNESGVTNITVGDVLISAGEVLTSTATLQNTASFIEISSSIIKDATIEAGNITIQTASPTGDIGGEILLKFGKSKSWGLKNTGALQIQESTGQPGQVLMSQGPSEPAVWQNVVSGGNNLPMVLAEAAPTPTQAEANKHYILVKNAPVTVRLPLSPATGDSFYITIANALMTNKIELSTVTDIISGVNEPCTLDVKYGTIGLKFVPTIGWVLL